MGKLVLNIRFVQHGQKDFEYTIQRKTFFGWRSYRYSVGGGAGDSVSYEYIANNKPTLLDKIIKDKYLTTKEFVRVIEHPMIKKY